MTTEGQDDRAVRTFAIPWGALGSRGQRVLFLLAYWIIASFFLHAHVATLALVLPLGAFLLFSLGGLELRVGEDGLLVGGIYFPYDRVVLESAERAPLSSRARARKGSTLRIVVEVQFVQMYIPSGRGWRLSRDEPKVRELEDHLRARLGRYEAADPTALPAVLDENFTSASYRASAITTETLWRVAENPRATPRIRIAATTALAAQANAEEQARLQLLSESTVDEELRERLALAVTTKR